MTRGQLPEVTRRVFLNRTLQALGAAASVSLAIPALSAARDEASGTRAEVSELHFLNPAEFAILDALAATFIPSGGAFELGARDVGLARRIDGYLPKLDPVVAVGFRGALIFVENQAPALAERPAPFSALADEDRERVLEAMLQQPGLPRGIFTAIKYFCMVHFYTIDDTWRFTGYDGPLVQGAS